MSALNKSFDTFLNFRIARLKPILKLRIQWVMDGVPGDSSKLTTNFTADYRKIVVKRRFANLINCDLNGCAQIC